MDAEEGAAEKKKDDVSIALPVFSSGLVDDRSGGEVVVVPSSPLPKKVSPTGNKEELPVLVAVVVVSGVKPF